MTAIQVYVQEIAKEYEEGRGKTTEHSYRPALKKLLEAVGDKGTHAINEPKRQGSNAPDFYIQRNLITVGFIEAKDVDKKLKTIEKTKQLKRYRKAYSNLLLTNQLEFRWYRDGKFEESVTIGKLVGDKIRFDEDAYPQLESLLRRYHETTAPVIYKSADLAERMAKMARELAILIDDALENPKPDSDLPQKKESVEKVLMPGMENREFADMFAQTIAYGLFAARAQFDSDEFIPEQFTLETAFFRLPQSNPFLQNLFQSLARNLDTRVRFMADLIVQLLAYAKGLDKVIASFGSRDAKQAAVIHFYEDFLRAYDSEQKENRGVYYTPEPVVNYIVRSVDHILKTTFRRVDGLADTETLILDPATGTGTFLQQVIEHIKNSMSGNEGMWKNYVQNHLLPRIFGFELLMAPYTVAHMSFNLLLERMDYDFNKKDRPQIYLTNTLTDNEKQPILPFAEHLSREANAAIDIKREKPIMVILGNPPYSNFGQMNKGTWITEQMKGWKPKGEKKWNPDDYMKFMRFAQLRIEETHKKTGSGGILAFVVSHSFIQGITHRKMRQSLMETFTDIYILDLHGNNFLGELAPDGGANENVFNIRQGVAIAIFVKDPKKQAMAQVYHADNWGKREEKFNWLSAHDISNTEWTLLEDVEQETCLGKFYFYSAMPCENIGEYCQGWALKNIFVSGQNGIKTDRNDLFFDEDRKRLTERVEKLYSGNYSSDFIEKYNVKDSSSYSLMSRLDTTNFDSINIRECLYRPFDTMYLYYDPNLTSRSAWDIMKHLIEPNYAILACRQQAIVGFQHIFCSDQLTECCAVSSESREITSVFPLYVYPDIEDNENEDVQSDTATKVDEVAAMDKFLNEAEEQGRWMLSSKGRRPNLNPKFVREMSTKLGLSFITEGTGDLVETFGPEDFFHYAYAVFHSPTYRKRYAECLKIDFPRLPLTGDTDLFRKLCGFGADLVQWHLMTHPDISQTTAAFPVEGSGEVISTYPKYKAQEQRVYINKTQYFANVPEEVWEFHIGGYQVLEKWLKDRKSTADKERKLNYEDVQHYRRIVKALQETMRLMTEIDKAIPGFPIV